MKAPLTLCVVLPLAAQNMFQGSVSSGQATSTPIMLSLQESIDLGLKNNLGLLTRDNSSRAARAERLRALSVLLPGVTGSISETAEQINLATFGFRFGGFPAVIGPFGYTDARASATATLFDWSARQTLKSESKNVRASDLSVQDARDLVVQAVSSAYLQIIASAARAEATQAQVATAQALYERARDQHQAGVSPAIDELRAQVELKTQQQVLLAQQNQLAKDRLALARAIGLPAGQVFEITDAAPYAQLEGLTPEDMLRRAYESRADYQSSKAQLEAAEAVRRAAVAQRYPTLELAANYGDIGVNLAHSHGTFGVTGSLKFNIFDGGRIRADVDQADIVIKQRREELSDLQGRIDFEVRTALLDLRSAADQVEVARSNLDLATLALTQARDRFAAGVTDNIEVVQAQESMANAQQSLISSTYAHNLAKVSLARAVGMAETSLKQFMGGK
jgi:outer membrane protein TolC